MGLCDPRFAACLLTGAVGEGAGVEFLSWLAHADLPDPDAVLADPSSFVLPERSDRAFAALTAVAALALRPAEAAELAKAGRTPAEVIAEWWGAGIPFAEVADWIGAGLTATEAVEQRAAGITVEQAAALRALRNSSPG